MAIQNAKPVPSEVEGFKTQIGVDGPGLGERGSEHRLRGIASMHRNAVIPAEVPRQQAQDDGPRTTDVPKD